MTGDLEARIERLDRSRRRLRWWAVTAAAVAFVLGMLLCQSAR